MTLSELLTDLESKPDIIFVGVPVQLNEIGILKRYDVPTVRLLGDNFAQGSSQPVIVLNEGDPAEAAYYNGKKNFNESAGRDQYYTDTQIKNALENNYPNYQVINMQVRVNGELDVVRVEVLDVTADEIVTRQLGIWKTDGGQPRYKWIKA